MKQEKFWVVASLEFNGQKFKLMSARKLSRDEMREIRDRARVEINIPEFNFSYASATLYEFYSFSDKQAAVDYCNGKTAESELWAAAIESGNISIDSEKGG